MDKWGKYASGLRAIMEWIDDTRRHLGKILDSMGLGPQETPYQIIATFDGARLRKYDHDESSGPNVLIIPAPFKRAYIWDLIPDVSVVRRCLEQGMQVFLLEWTTPNQQGFGLREYTDTLPLTAVNAIKANTQCQAPVLLGHSLGGTFAAIFASLFPERVHGLVLVDTPLAFGQEGGPLAEAIAKIPDLNLFHAFTGNAVSGTLINLLSLAAAPEVFHFQTLSDLAACSFNPKAMEIHARVSRWAYDEFPLPWRLFEEITEQLFRNNAFLQGGLKIGKRYTSLAQLRSPTLAIVNPFGGVVPPDSLIKGLQSTQAQPFKVLIYESDCGPVIQHLGPLVSQLAHQQLWPQILDWIIQTTTKHN